MFLFIASSVPELQSKIVLSPQFLVNALKSLITAEMFYKKKAEMLDKLMEFRRKGILKIGLIGTVFFYLMNFKAETKTVVVNAMNFYKSFHK